MKIALAFHLLFTLQVMERALFHCENAYKIPNLRVAGHVCKTNIPSNTAFRGFGGPQGMMMAEHVITDVAITLGMSPVKVVYSFSRGDILYNI